ncbi:hypothetical protein EJB05_53572, partial [Eragrostis curvula]
MLDEFTSDGLRAFQDLPEISLAGREVLAGLLTFDTGEADRGGGGQHRMAIICQNKAVAVQARVLRLLRLDSDKRLSSSWAGMK